MTNYQDKRNDSKLAPRGGKRRHGGGTIIGFILGLIVGLGIALGVAMTIQKIPVPFLNKLGKPDKVPDLTPAQAADPNKPLYGNKEPAKEAAKDFVKEGESAADAGKAKPAVKPVEAGKPVDAKDTKLGAAKPDLASDEKWIYYLQAGAFRDQVDADSTKARLALVGFEAAISERSSESGMLYRVRIGPFNQVETMNRARTKLSDNGMDVAVIKIAK
jgi:cell division protein FtsN